MNLEPPVTLAELAADGAIVSTSQDFAAAAKFGRMTSVEFTTPQPDDPALDAPTEVRIRNAHGQNFTVTGTRIAEVHGESWQWLTHRAPQATYQATEEVRAAARTLLSGAMLINALRPDSSHAVIALDLLPTSPAHTREAFIHGLARLDYAHLPLAYRSVLAAASAWDLPVREVGDRVDIATATGELAVQFTGTYAREVQFPGALRGQDLLADAAYLSQEAQFFFEATGATSTPAVEVARFTDTHFWWQHSAITQFGFRNGLLDLARSVVDPRVCDPELLAISAKPILGLWAHRFVDRGTYTAVELAGVDLPAATTHVRDAVVACPLPEGVDPHRARASYRTARGI